MRWGTRPRWVRWTAAAYVVALVEGACVHAYYLFADGIHAYRGLPLGFRLVFHLLLVLDPLAALWVARGRPAGPALAAAIMAADLAGNWQWNWDAVLRDPLSYLQPIGLLPITLFGLFVFATAPPLRRSFLAAGRSAEGATDAARIAQA